MAKFGKQSLKNLIGVHPLLIDVLTDAIQHVDFTVLEGVRALNRQKTLYESGASSTMDSMHLKQPDGFAHAVDVAPYPIDWSDKRRFAYLAGLIMGVAESKGIKLTWGNDWDNDGDFDEHKLQDGPHFQLRKS